MKRQSRLRLAGLVLASMALCVAVLAMRSAPPRSVPIRNACNTFVATLSPLATPALRRGKPGLQLHISFTPANDEEADAIRGAVEAGTRELRIDPGGRMIEAVGIEHHNLVLAVKSPEHARELLHLLCFSGPDDASEVPLSVE